MTNGLFKENMSSSEVRMAFFRAIEGKTKEEIEQLQEDYSKIQAIIMDREFALADEGWCID